MNVIDGRALFGCSLDEWAHDRLREIAKQLDVGAPLPGRLPRVVPPLTQIALDAPPLHARVNHSRWIVDCPCNGAAMVWLDAPLQWCTECANAMVGGAWRVVVVPDALERAAIDALLGARPSLPTRNWVPGEPLENLRAENRAHGHDVTA